MKKTGTFLTTLGLLYACLLLSGTQPRAESWWVYIIMGVTTYSIGEFKERRERAWRNAEATRKVNAILERQREWERENGL